jgi:Ca2+-binding RTX toxin-like protein
VNLGTGVGSGDGFGRDTLRRIEGAWAGGGSDTLVGNDGPNLFYTGSMGNGVDRVNGAGGSDTLTFDGLEVEGLCCDSVNIDLRAGRGRWGGSVLVFSSIENVLGDGDDDVILGDDRNNVLIGGTDRYDGGDTIRGRGGNDVLRGTGGKDHLYGDAGDDRLVGGWGVDLLDGGTGKNHNDGGHGVDTCIKPSAGPRVVGCEKS